MFIYLDIETIASKDVPDNFLKIDSRLKDPEKIAIAKQTAMEKSVFDGAFGEVVSIAWAVNDGTVKSVCRDDELTEKRMLEMVTSQISADCFDVATKEGIDQYRKTWVGHHIAFDLGFLFKRLAINEIKSKIKIPWPVNAWDKSINDTMYMWEGRNPVSLDKLCYVLLGEGKDTKGSDVAGMWERKEFDNIANYNKDDVEKTREIHKKMRGVFCDDQGY